MARADFRRFNEDARNAISQSLKLGSHDFVSGASVRLSNSEEAWNVLKKDERRPRPVDNPAHDRPEMARVGAPALLACDTEGLTREACSDDIHASTPASSVEGSQFRPDRSGIKSPNFHLVRQDCGREGFDLHSTDEATRWKDASDGELEATDAGAERQDGGTCSHIGH